MIVLDLVVQFIVLAFLILLALVVFFGCLNIRHAQEEERDYPTANLDPMERYEVAQNRV